MTTVIAAKTFSDGVLSMYEGERRRIDDAVATAYIAAGLVTEYTGDVTPEGIKEITTNGLHDVYGYASAQVDVPNPSTGTLEITENGTYDVTDKASAVVNVEGGGGGEAIFRGLLFSDEITTSESSGEYYGEWTGDYSDFVMQSKVDVVVNDTTYNNVPTRFVDSYYEVGAPLVNDARDFSEYPFCFRITSGMVDGDLFTEEAGTYAITVYNVAVYTTATIEITNELESNTRLVDANGPFSTNLLAGETQEVSMALVNGSMDYYFSADSYAVAVTGDITWDDSEAYGVISGDGTITISAAGGGA